MVGCAVGWGMWFGGGVGCGEEYGWGVGLVGVWCCVEGMGACGGWFGWYLGMFGRVVSWG